MKNIMEPDTDILTEQEIKTDILDGITSEYGVLVYNDDVNTFDYVIICFILICRLSIKEAAECADIIHNNGKHIVKKGDKKTIQDMVKKLTDKRLTAEMVRLL